MRSILKSYVDSVQRKITGKKQDTMGVCVF